MQKIIYPSIVQVDDEGKVIGPIAYEIAHNKHSNMGIRHLTSNVLIFENDSRKKLLLSRRNSHINCRGVLNISAGGHAIWLEEEVRALTPLETVLKELQEELFKGTKLPEKLNKLENITSFTKQIRPYDREYTYLFEGFYKGPFTLNTREVTEVFFADFNELVKDVSTNPRKYVKSMKIYLDRYIASRNR